MYVVTNWLVYIDIDMSNLKKANSKWQVAGLSQGEYEHSDATVAQVMPYINLTTLTHSVRK